MGAQGLGSFTIVNSKRIQSRGVNGHIVRCAYALVAWLCPTLCNPKDYSPLDSSLHGILQARILEWVAISFSKGSSQPRDQTCISCSAEFFTTDPPGKPYAKDTNIQSKKWRLAHLDFQKSFCPHVDTLSIAFRTLYVWAVLLFFFLCHVCMPLLQFTLHSAMYYTDLSRKLVQASFIYVDSCIDHKREMYNSVCPYLHTWFLSSSSW